MPMVRLVRHYSALHNSQWFFVWWLRMKTSYCYYLYRARRISQCSTLWRFSSRARGLSTRTSTTRWLSLSSTTRLPTRRIPTARISSRWGWLSRWSGSLPNTTVSWISNSHRSWYEQAGGRFWRIWIQWQENSNGFYQVHLLCSCQKHNSNY